MGITIKEKVLNLLKTGWYSNFQINLEVKSSSADRAMRKIRENPPEGWVIVQRNKLLPDGYNPCLEYTLMPNK